MDANANNDDEFITLTQAAKVAPGRPSANTVWRWARRGVMARGGMRVFLEHARVGGKIFTTAQWVKEFGQHLAAADHAHFQMRNGVPVTNASSTELKSTRQSDVERDLEEAGL